MTEKRPRINPELAAEVDAARGMVPFEPYVNSLIVRGLHNTPADAEAALRYIAEEHCNYDLKAYDELVAKVRAEMVEAYDETALEQEWDEEL